MINADDVDPMPDDDDDTTDDQEAKEKTDKAEKRSIASQLVDLARSDYELGVSDDGIPFGSRPDVPHVAMPLRGGKFGLRAELGRHYFEKCNAVPSSQALTDAINVLEGYAAQENPKRLHLRVGAANNTVYIHCADNGDRVIAINDGNWNYTEYVPIVFRRTELTAPMPEPVRGGDVCKLWKHVNVALADRPLMLAHMVSAWIQPDRPHPILGLVAEHGSAKSSTTRCYVSLVDPSVAPLRMCPRDPDQWVTAAAGSYVVALDNVSTIADWFSDSLCRAATGEANVKRQLYTDTSLTVIKFHRVVLINGIDLGGLNGDFADRLLPVDLKRISESERRDEADLEAGWNKDRPEIVGGLLDLAARVHQMLPTITVDRMPRMADFAKVLACIDQIHKTDGLTRYRERAAHLAADAVTSDAFIAWLITLQFSCVAQTGAEILASVRPDEKDWKLPSGWPKQAREVTTRLTRHAPALRSLGCRSRTTTPRTRPTPPGGRSPRPHRKIGAGNLPRLPRLPRRRRSTRKSPARQTEIPTSPLPRSTSPTTTVLTSEDEAASQARQEYGPHLFAGQAPTFDPPSGPGRCPNAVFASRSTATTAAAQQTSRQPPKRRRTTNEHRHQRRPRHRSATRRRLGTPSPTTRSTSAPTIPPGPSATTTPTTSRFPTRSPSTRTNTRRDWTPPPHRHHQPARLGRARRRDPRPNARVAECLMPPGAAASV